MKSIAVLGTSSNAGKSWVTTALCAWLRRQGLRVAPFKAQNMSNNSFVTLEGGEIGRAQAAQAEACGLRPVAEMNPILLKPSGNSRSQLVLLGQAGEHIAAADYYQHIDRLWEVVAQTLADWRDRCDVLVLEGAGSPVELNLMHRDLVNLRPIEHLQGRWLLVGDIERGGIFAQAVGTYQLMPRSAQALGLGLVVNKFRGDLRLFADADRYFQQHLPHLPYLGTLPYAAELQPESEDSLCRSAEEAPAECDHPVIAWIRFPFLSNSQDSQPWSIDQGVAVRWVTRPAELATARAIVLPGSKNTLRDLAWLQETGLAAAIQRAAAQGVPVVGICGGYQMLGRSLVDRTGIAGAAGEMAGLGLLPVETDYFPQKTVRQVTAHWPSPAGATPPHDIPQVDRWQAYEIHMGQTRPIAPCDRLLTLEPIGQPPEPEGARSAQGYIWGTYVHGLFESAAVRQTLTHLAGITTHRPNPQSWQQHRQQLYDRMADLLETSLTLDRLCDYLEV
ncbi:MAG: cobyric acid synthase [Limnothrix sp. BL-A-16]